MSGPLEHASSDRTLAIDIGAGTQDLLLYDPDRTPENCFRMVLPSRTQIVAARIRKLTRLRKPLHLTGKLMGGGASSEAIRAHLEAGLAVSAEPEPAATLHNDTERVVALGVEITDAAPPDSAVIELGDVDLSAIETALAQFELELPCSIAIAVQDHGYRPGSGNNEMRFDYLQSLLDGGGDLARMVFESSPPGMTRMAAVFESIGEGVVMDTGAAAVLGALGDPVAGRTALDEGVILVNVGNMHTFATLIRGRRLYGLFEHHTGGITPAIISTLVDGLRSGTLDAESFMRSFDGHGAAIHPDYHREGPFEFVAITGPNRALARGLGYHEAAPFGDMMMSGAFGLVEGVLMRQVERGERRDTLIGR